MTQEKITPLMQQYFDIKDQYKDTLILFQVGDFYELFFDDAKTAASFLAIALTKRGKNQGQDVPLCGIPVHALNHYLKKLITGGFKVAICDQLSKPQPGIVVQRGVTRVLTPGTLTDSTMLDEKSASYLLSFYPEQNQWGLIFTELLTAQLFATHIDADDFKTFEAELTRFSPDEIVLPPSQNSFETFFKKNGYCTSLVNGDYALTEPISTAWLQAQFNKQTLELLQKKICVNHALELLYRYLKKNQEKSLDQFQTIQFYQPQDYLILDPATQKNLEIIRNNHNGDRKNTLLSIVDHAKTAMGSRTLKKWLARPLLQKNAILGRQEVVSCLCNNIDTMQKLENLLSHIADLERIIGRIALRRAHVQDYLALKDSLAIAPEIKALLQTSVIVSLAQTIQEKIGDFKNLIDLLETSLNNDPSSDLIIKKSFDLHLDHLRNLVQNSQQEILKLEQKERARTGINSLKISYNRVSGYYFEITNPNLKQVPQDFIEQQKLVNRKRFVTQELKALERDIFTAQHEIEEVEAKVFDAIKQEVEQYLTPLRNLAQALAYLDGLFSFATVAYNNNYIAPIFNDKQNVEILQGRHPVIETKCSTAFVANDTILNNEQSLLIITGPNMGGKSTFLRQTALIAILAQCGSFVPARQANLPLFDRIFTRIGSADNLAEGKSTFLVEMEETAAICTQATKNSLIVLDEVGRGTSTHDGIALAQAIIEYIVQHIQARTLFATHYHELTELDKQFTNIKNYNLLCSRIKNHLHFLHKIAPGTSQRSFGLDVAKLAQLPDSIITRASHLLHAMENKSQTTIQPALSHVKTENFTPTSIEKIAHLEKQLEVYKEKLKPIQDLNLDELSPKQAFDLLWNLASNK
ncbi:MAG: DNA mismatch repair protein MutS [bacterium]